MTGVLGARRAARGVGRSWGRRGRERVMEELERLYHSQRDQARGLWRQHNGPN